MGRRQSGDTLVEVLMSLAVLGMVIVGAVSIMARGLTATQMALEHSETRQGINSQLEMLRYLRDQYAINSTSTDAATWTSIISSSNTTATDYTSGCNVTGAKAGTAFYLSKTSGVVQKVTFDASQKPTTFALAGKGMWVEATPSTGGVSPAYIDFVVRACWSGIGASATQQQTVTAERLYDSSR